MSDRERAVVEFGHSFVDDLSLLELCSQPLKSMMRVTENKKMLRKINFYNFKKQAYYSSEQNLSSE